MSVYDIYGKPEYLGLLVGKEEEDGGSDGSEEVDSVSDNCTSDERDVSDGEGTDEEYDYVDFSMHSQPKEKAIALHGDPVSHGSLVASETKSHVFKTVTGRPRTLRERDPRQSLPIYTSKPREAFVRGDHPMLERHGAVPSRIRFKRPDPVSREPKRGFTDGERTAMLSKSGKEMLSRWSVGLNPRPENRLKKQTSLARHTTLTGNPDLTSRDSYAFSRATRSMMSDKRAPLMETRDGFETEFLPYEIHRKKMEGEEHIERDPKVMMRYENLGRDASDLVAPKRDIGQFDVKTTSGSHPSLHMSKEHVGTLEDFDAHRVDVRARREMDTAQHMPAFNESHLVAGRGVDDTYDVGAGLTRSRHTHGHEFSTVPTHTPSLSAHEHRKVGDVGAEYQMRHRQGFGFQTDGPISSVSASDMYSMGKWDTRAKLHDERDMDPRTFGVFKMENVDSYTPKREHMYMSERPQRGIHVESTEMPPRARAAPAAMFMTTGTGPHNEGVERRRYTPDEFYISPTLRKTRPTDIMESKSPGLYVADRRHGHIEDEATFGSFEMYGTDRGRKVIESSARMQPHKGRGLDTVTRATNIDTGGMEIGHAVSRTHFDVDPRASEQLRRGKDKMRAMRPDRLEGDHRDEFQVYGRTTESLRKHSNVDAKYTEARMSKTHRRVVPDTGMEDCVISERRSTGMLKNSVAPKMYVERAVGRKRAEDGNIHCDYDDVVDTYNYSRDHVGTSDNRDLVHSKMLDDTKYVGAEERVIGGDALSKTEKTLKKQSKLSRRRMRKQLADTHFSETEAEQTEAETVYTSAEETDTW